MTSAVATLQQDDEPSLGIFAWQGTEAFVASVALIFSVAALILTVLRDRRVDTRDDRVEKSTAYLELEVHSSEAFRYAAENCEAMRPFKATERPSHLNRPSRRDEEVTRQYYYQCLNLFEVCSNFRRSNVIRPEVYASWVAWFHEVLDQWYFRELWVEEMRDNYTPDVRDIFDLGLQVYREHADDETRRKEFYHAVSHLMGGCETIRDWIENLGRQPEWPAKEQRS